MSKQKALSAIIFCVLIWGFSFVSTKITLAVFPPMSLGMLRFAIALIFLYFIKLKLAPNEKLRIKDIPLLFAAGFSGVTMYFFFENNGIALVSASEASIAVSTIPIITMITEWFIVKPFLRRKRMAHNTEQNEPAKTKVLQWIGCIVSIAGVWLVAGVSFAISGSIIGYIYMAGAVLSWVVYSFLTRPLFASHSGIYIVFWQSVAGFICFIPFSIVEFQSWGKATVEAIIHLVFLGIFCSAIGYWLYVRALDILGVTVCAIFINLVPMVTVIAGFFMLGERLMPLQWLGAALVITGVYLSMNSEQLTKMP